MVGVLILDQYYLIEMLGKGGMSEVYLAEQTSMDRHAAVKILRARRAFSEDAARRFRVEARAISRLSHQHIVTVYNFGELADGSLFLAMEHVDGIGLEQLLDKEGAIPPMRAINIVFQCAQALGYAHTHKIVHRDFKPENVMLAKQLGRDHVKLLDFGIARLLDDSYASQPGAIIGTPQYLSPEQCRGETASAFSDQYALGLVFYELLTGQIAIMADRLINYLHMHQYSMPKPPSEVRQERAVALCDPVVMRMLAKNPMERFGSMDEVQGALKSVAAAIAKLDKPATPRARTKSGGARGSSGAVKALAPGMTLDQQSTPARVVVLESTAALTKPDWEQLRHGGFQLQGTCEQPAQLPAALGDAPPDLFVLATGAETWRRSLKLWTDESVPQRKVLTCVDGTIDPLVGLEAIKHLSHVVVGPHPLSPDVVLAAMRWMLGRGHGMTEALAGGNTVQLLQISSSALKGHYLESVYDDMRANGVRRPVLRAVRELAEEMVMNALYHAPVSAAGWKSQLHPSPGQPVTLRPGQEATLRWAIGDDQIVLSIRDPFGSLTARQLVNALMGRAPSRRAGSDQWRGGGLGLRIMLRAANHLMFLISPGHSCEVVALVDQAPSSASRAHRTLSVLQGWDQQIQQLGDRLWLHEGGAEGKVALRLHGDINENCDLTAVFNREGEVLLDLSGVAAINSRGIHLWLDAARRRNPRLTLVLQRCSPAMVSQFSMIPALAATGRIDSVLAPYFCPSCRKETTEVLEADELQQDNLPPPRSCLVCSTELEFDELPEEYFAFTDDG